MTALKWKVLKLNRKDMASSNVNIKVVNKKTGQKTSMTPEQADILRNNPKLNRKFKIEEPAKVPAEPAKAASDKTAKA